MKRKSLLMMLLLALLVPLATFAQQSLPYSYGFENNDVIAEGWTLPSVNHTSTNIAAGGAIHTGNKGFQFFYGSNPVYDQYLISPELNGTTNGVAVSFWYKNYNTSYNATFQVGYSSTDTELESFEWLYATTTTSAYWQQSVAFNCPAGTKYVAIKCKTNYYFFVDDISFTEPSVQSLPYSYGFESSNTELTEGWTTVNRSQYTYVATGGAIHDGSKGFEFWGTTTATYNPQYLISPELDGSKVAYTFYYKSYNNATHQFQLGYSTTSDLTSDAWVWSDTKTSTGDWMQLDEQVCPAGTKYVAVKYLSTAGYFFIDDFTFTVPVDCDIPETLEASGITINGADLIWTGGSGTYNVEFKKASDADWTSHATNLTTSSTTLSGLEPGTSYQARVQSVCKGGEVLSGWKSCEFVTECEEATLPYTYGFEDSESNKWNCWEKGAGITIATGAAIHEGAKGLQFYGASGQAFTSPVLDGTENGVAFYFYYGVYSGTQTFQVGYFDGTEWTWTDDIEASNVTNTDGWLQYVNEQIPENTTQVAIMCTSSGYFFVDDINITEAPSCVAPTNLTVSEITATTALLSWTGGSGTYGVDYQQANQNWLESPLTHTGASYTLNNLTPNTTYQARVQSICGEDESEWSNIVEFTTACGAYDIPYEYGFEEAEEYNCWTPEGASNTFRTTSTGAHTGTYVFQFFNNDNNDYPEQYLYTPELAGNGTDQIAISFWYRNWASYYNTSFQVGYKAEEAGNFIWEAAVAVVGNAWTEYFSILPASTKYVAVKCSVHNPGTGNDPVPGNSWFLLDDFSFTYLPKSFVTAGAWGNADNWLPAGAPAVTEDVLVLAAASVEAGTVATANTITLKNAGSITIKDGGQLKHNTTGLTATVEKEITGYTDQNEASGYYLIATPITVAAYDDADVTNLASNTYDLYAYEQAPDDELEWRNFKNAENNLSSLTPNEGYLYANSETMTLQITGTLTTTMQPANLTYSGDGLKSLNLMGNPLPHNVTLYVYDNQHNQKTLNFLTMNDVGDGFITTTANQFNAVPMQGFFVQATEANLHLTDQIEAGGGSGGGWGDDEEEFGVGPRMNSLLNITLHNGGNLIDNAIIFFANGSMMNKYYLNENSTRLYIPQGGQELAVVRSNGQGEMPVNFKAAANGNYSISVNLKNVEMDYLHLIDNLTGADIDLIANPSYSFEANTNDYATRFRVVFSADFVANDNDSNFAYFNGSEYVVSNQGQATLQVVDVMGRIISSQTISGNAEVNVNEACGVYMLRLVNGDNVKTQKIVIQ